MYPAEQSTLKSILDAVTTLLQLAVLLFAALLYSPIYFIKKAFRKTDTAQ